MIKHNILVVKTAPVISIGFAPGRHIPITQEELKKQVDHYGFATGDFVTMAQHAESLYNVHCVVHITTDLAKCHYVNGKPAAYLLCQVQSASTTGWIRFDTPNDYRILSAEEHKRLIGADGDNIRHSCYEQSKYLIPNPNQAVGSPI